MTLEQCAARPQTAGLVTWSWQSLKTFLFGQWDHIAVQICIKTVGFKLRFFTYSVADLITFSEIPPCHTWSCVLICEIFDDIGVVLFCSETASHWKAAGRPLSAQRPVTRRLLWTSMATLTQASSLRTAHSSVTMAQTRGQDELVPVNTWRRRSGNENSRKSLAAIVPLEPRPKAVVFLPQQNARDICGVRVCGVCHTSIRRCWFSRRILWSSFLVFLFSAAHRWKIVNAITCAIKNC